LSRAMARLTRSLSSSNSPTILSRSRACLRRGPARKLSRAGRVSVRSDCLPERTGFELAVPPVSRNSGRFLQFCFLRGRPPARGRSSGCYETRLQAIKGEEPEVRIQSAPPGSRFKTRGGFRPRDRVMLSFASRAAARVRRFAAVLNLILLRGSPRRHQPSQRLRLTKGLSSKLTRQRSWSTLARSPACSQSSQRRIFGARVAAQAVPYGTLS